MALNIKTQEQILQDMLNNISDDYEKSAGFLTYDLTKTNAIEMSVIYSVIENLLNKIDVDNLKDEELTKYVLQRKGIKRKEATFAKVDLEISGTGTINEGDLFSTVNNIQFKSLETKQIIDNDTVLAQCLESGSIGMVGANSITQFPVTIQGFTSVNNPNSSYDGFEAESDSSLRERYYTELQKPATSGNKYHYRNWTNAVAGVGDARVFPLWNGAGTVKVLIIDSNKQPATQTLIDEVQKNIDPKGEYDSETDTWSKWGQGYGKAPIGAYTTVTSATGLNIDVDVDVDLANGYTIEEVKINIKNSIAEYLKEIAFDEQITYVSYAKVGALILSADGVLDYTNLTVNNGTDNITIGEEEVAIVGNVVVI
ncbi:MAG: hypothetical protein FH753_01035 [Firmicutes bacterium]|nr:hypothetical protein [Bacillota bacterium]